MLAFEQPVAADLERALRKLFTQRLKGFGIEKILVFAERDHADIPAIMVEVSHRKVDYPIPLRKVIEVDREARNLAAERGEPRCVYIRHLYDEDQEATDE